MTEKTKIVGEVTREQKARWNNAARAGQQTLWGYITALADVEAARRLDDPRVWTPEQDALLGTMPDGKLADKTGKSWAQVRHRRASLGIPACSPAGRPNRPGNGIGVENSQVVTPQSSLRRAIDSLQGTLL